MIDNCRHEIVKLKSVLKKPSHTDRATSPLRQQTAPIPSDEIFITEFQLQITEFSALIATVQELRNWLSKDQSPVKPFNG